MLVSIVIPFLNEAAHLEETLSSLRDQTGPFELILVDGGSSDQSVEIARRYGRVLRSRRGRSSQMNAGASEARGDILLFLHADTYLPPEALSRIRLEMDDPSSIAGTFQLSFDSSSRLLGFYCWCTRLRHPAMCFGDRGLFVKKTAFFLCGGFPDIPIFEDVQLARRLFRRESFRFLDLTVSTSSRRFDSSGRIRHQIRNTLLWLAYFAGFRPEFLSRFYPYPRTICDL
jgi:rSAM/selenodomain-associated transferase 2